MKKFSTIEKSDNVKKSVQQIKEKKREISEKKKKSKSILIIQRYLRGFLIRNKTKHSLQESLTKKCTDLDTLQKILKQKLFYPPLKISLDLLRDFLFLSNDKYINSTSHLELFKNLLFWLSRNVENPARDNSMICVLITVVESPTLQHMMQRERIFWLLSRLVLILMKNIEKKIISSNGVLFLSKLLHFKEYAEPSAKQHGDLLFKIICNVTGSKIKIQKQLRHCISDSIPTEFYEVEKLSEGKLEFLEKSFMASIEIFSEFDGLNQVEERIPSLGSHGGEKQRKNWITLFQGMDATLKYNMLINLQIEFVEEILSISGLVPLFLFITEKHKIGARKYKNMFQAYLFSSLASSNSREEEHKALKDTKEKGRFQKMGDFLTKSFSKSKYEEEKYIKPNLKSKLIETYNKREECDSELCLFGNLFELISKYFIKVLNAYEIFPLIQLCSRNVNKLSSGFFNPRYMHADDKFGIMAFKKQLSLFGLSHVALAVFGAIFGTQLQNGGKVDFNDAFDPQAALALCTLYSKVLEKASKFKKASQEICAALAFDEKIIFKIWKFIDLYVESTSSIFLMDNHIDFLHALSLFASSYTYSLWISNFEDFLNDDLFEKQDIVRIINLYKHTLLELFNITTSHMTPAQHELNAHFISTFSLLLRTVFDFFDPPQFVPEEIWIYSEINWEKSIDINKQEIMNSVPMCVPFNVRVGVLQHYIEFDKAKYKDFAPVRIRIRRQNIFEDGRDAFNQLPDIKALSSINFINQFGVCETGIDTGGLFKEFLGSLSSVIFDPNYGLFQITELNKQLYPNFQSRNLFGQSQTELYIFIGKVLGKAIYEQIVIEPQFADFFLRKMLGKPNFFNDLKSLDPELYKHLQFLRHYEGNMKDLELYFSITEEFEIGEEKKEIELIPNGRNVLVTNKNKFRYIYYLAHYRLNVRIKEQTSAFLLGLQSCIPLEKIKMFSEKELQMIISGTQHIIDIKDLEKYTKYAGCSRSDKHVKMFWKVLKLMSEDNKSKLLKFATSCSRPPLFGFRNLQPPFTIQKITISHDEDKLPSASTCFNILKIPTYSGWKILKRKLEYAINSQSGFELT